MRVRLTKRARSNLDAIFRYVSADDPHAAANLVREIEDLIGHLTEFPTLGRAADSSGRFVLTAPRAPYQVFYRIAGGRSES